MREATIQELVKDLQGKVIRGESADIYGVNLYFSKARIEYVVESITFEYDGSILLNLINTWRILTSKKAICKN